MSMLSPTAGEPVHCGYKWPRPPATGSAGFEVEQSSEGPLSRIHVGRFMAGSVSSPTAAVEHSSSKNLGFLTSGSVEN